LVEPAVDIEINQNNTSLKVFAVDSSFFDIFSSRYLWVKKGRYHDLRKRGSSLEATASLQLY
jgi:hypothetical protein